MSIKRSLFLILYIFIVILFSIVAIEFYCRFKGLGVLGKFRVSDYPSNEIFTPSNFLPYELSPNIPNFSNSLGMRDKEYNIKKPKNIFRIVVLGDSITMYGKYTDFLEDNLNEYFDDNIEVWNCSIGGHGVKEYYYNLNYRSIKYDPDMLIIGFCLDDFSPVRVMFKTKDGEKHCYRPFQINKGNFDNFLYCHSNFYRIVLSNIERNYIKRYAPSPQKYGREYLGRIKDIALRKNIPLFGIIFPYYIPGSEEMAQYKVIKNVIEELDIEYIDLHKIFTRESRISYLDRPEEDVVHPNENAHKVVADVLMKYIIDNRLISKVEI